MCYFAWDPYYSTAQQWFEKNDIFTNLYPSSGIFDIWLDSGTYVILIQPLNLKNM